METFQVSIEKAWGVFVIQTTIGKIYKDDEIKLKLKLSFCLSSPNDFFKILLSYFCLEIYLIHFSIQPDVIFY